MPLVPPLGMATKRCTQWPCETNNGVQVSRRPQCGSSGKPRELPAGRDPNGPGHDLYLDITRIRQDTGYQPGFDAERATAGYIGWLRAGNER